LKRHPLPVRATVFRVRARPSPLCGPGHSHMVDWLTSRRPSGERPFDNRSGGPAPQAREGEGDEPLSCCRLTKTGGGSSPSPSHRRGDGSPPLPEGRGENTCCRHMRLPCPATGREKPGKSLPIAWEG